MLHSVTCWLLVTLRHTNVHLTIWHRVTHRGSLHTLASFHAGELVSATSYHYQVKYFFV